jgi:UDP-glucose 4-epimerase
MVHPETYFRNNTASTLAMLEAVIAEGPRRVVFSSTAAVYGEPESVPITENARLKPTNVYGESKLMVETMLNWFHSIHGLRSVALRYFNVAGAPEGPNGITRGEDHEPESHLIPLILDVALGRRKSIRIYGDDYSTPDGTCIRDYIHILDLARAHILALNSEKNAFYNLGTGGGSSVREVIDAARSVTGREIAVVEKPRRPGDPPRLIASSEKIRRELGW